MLTCVTFSSHHLSLRIGIATAIKCHLGKWLDATTTTVRAGSGFTTRVSGLQKSPRGNGTVLSAASTWRARTGRNCNVLLHQHGGQGRGGTVTSCCINMEGKDGEEL
jgi:hypothetical protein